jgi:hypothetical protein
MTSRFSRVVVSAALVTLAGCSASSDPQNPTGPGRASHNQGRDCLECHSFTVAGTAYQADGTNVAPGATIRLTSQPGASEAVDLTLTADSSGNFYTNARVAFGAGLAATAAGGGAARAMQDAVTSGACNSCHTSASRLRVN